MDSYDNNDRYGKNSFTSLKILNSTVINNLEVLHDTMDYIMDDFETYQIIYVLPMTLN